MADPTPPPENGANGERLNLKAIGQSVALQSRWPVVFGLLVLAVTAMLWIALEKVSSERKDMLTQFLGTIDTMTQQSTTALTALAVQQREDNREMRQLLQTKHEAVQERLLHLFQGLIRALWIVDHNAGLAPEKRIPFGAMPPDIEDLLKVPAAPPPP